MFSVSLLMPLNLLWGLSLSSGAFYLSSKGTLIIVVILISSQPTYTPIVVSYRKILLATHFGFTCQSKIMSFSDLRKE